MEDKLTIIDKGEKGFVIRMPADLPIRAEKAKKLAEKLNNPPVETVELVEVKVMLPKNVFEFFENLLRFCRYKEPLEEFLGKTIVWMLDAERNSRFENIIDAEGIVKGYNLNTAFEHFTL